MVGPEGEYVEPPLTACGQGLNLRPQLCICSLSLSWFPSTFAPSPDACRTVCLLRIIKYDYHSVIGLTFAYVAKFFSFKPNNKGYQKVYRKADMIQGLNC